MEEIKKSLWNKKRADTERGNGGFGSTGGGAGCV